MNLPGWASTLPHVNAGLNGAALILLLIGFALIRSGHVKAHACVMVSAFVMSSAFLACYLVYHQALLHYTGSGSRGFSGTGLVRRGYLTILLTHTVLAIVVPLLAIRMFYLAWRGRWTSHRRLGQVAFPIWVYVSATGVIIYWMLYHMPVGQGAS